MTKRKLAQEIDQILKEKGQSTYYWLYYKQYTKEELKEILNALTKK